MIALIASLIAVAAFFFPYVSATEEYGAHLERLGDMQVSQSLNMTYRNMKALSLFDYARVYFLGAEEIMGGTMGTIYGVTMSSIGVFSLLVLLAVLWKKPILSFILTAMLGGACYLVNWDFVDRGIMPASNRVWGISFYVLYACVAVIALSAIWMHIEKRRMKKEAKAVPA